MTSLTDDIFCVTLWTVCLKKVEKFPLFISLILHPNASDSNMLSLVLSSGSHLPTNQVQLIQPGDGKPRPKSILCTPFHSRLELLWLVGKEGPF